MRGEIVAMMTDKDLEKIIGYREQIEPCPRCESSDIEFIFNVLDPTAPENFTARCRDCDYTMHGNDAEQLLAEWNDAAESARRIDYANDER